MFTSAFHYFVIQVRHYYYRLVRRMNKLLGPGFSLDAKNSKDTNAAMLRWWSLLEKYSCTASKLHLKPRRFKTFIETLAQQLLKDRNRTRRKRPFQGENCSTIPLAAESIFSKPPGHDVHMVKLVFVDSQNTQKLGNTKGASTKRGVSASVNGYKGDVSTMKTASQKRRAGSMASTAYKRWEKAAIAGVSLVADAAEHLERTSNDRNGSIHQGTLDMLSQSTCTTNGHLPTCLSGDVAQPINCAVSDGLCSLQQIGESNAQPSMKLKLQLFPIDEVTRKALERDDRNPHLELTLSARKRISSILEHLHRKWGNSSIASGELMLFPYSIQQDNIVSCPRWTLKDTAASAGDVYASVGSPAIFRLRYGWFSNLEPSSPHESSCMQAKSVEEEDASIRVSPDKSVTMDSAVGPYSSISQVPDRLIVGVISNLTSVGSAAVPPPIDIQTMSVSDGIVQSKNEQLISLQKVDDSSVCREVVDDMDEQEYTENLRACDGATISAGEWADSLTNISVGDLFSEASRVAYAYNNTNNSLSPWANSSHLQHLSLSCDSFDAAIAGLLSRHQDMVIPSNRASPASILDAEETCDEFSFHKILALNQDNLDPPSPFSTAPSEQFCQAGSNGYQGFLKDFTAEVEPLDDSPPRVDIDANPPHDELISDTKSDPEKNVDLADFCWPDSLGPLDLDIASTRYQGQDLLFSENTSLSGLTRLIASSLDAFQNCSFFCSDKKESLSSEVQDAPSFIDNKVGTEG
ncbi:hypothetical protein Taro_029369 [Colocasia esculenta]|uniref:TSL-kinase interacting protein 1 n=1 Tax=Colocasia esculenta TaxID=4460 RepID=A0A843W027_COLES|nr:hypothetical protein [Colocasia esculenta]